MIVEGGPLRLANRGEAEEGEPEGKGGDTSHKIKCSLHCTSCFRASDSKIISYIYARPHETWCGRCWLRLFEHHSRHLANIKARPIARNRGAPLSSGAAAFDFVCAAAEDSRLRGFLPSCAVNLPPLKRIWR